MTGEAPERASGEYFWNEVVDHHTYALGEIAITSVLARPDRSRSAPKGRDL